MPNCADASDRFRWGPLALCAACLFVEGYDGQFMGYVVPGIAADSGTLRRVRSALL